MNRALVCLTWKMANLPKVWGVFPTSGEIFPRVGKTCQALGNLPASGEIFPEGGDHFRHAGMFSHRPGTIREGAGNRRKLRAIFPTKHGSDAERTKMSVPLSAPDFPVRPFLVGSFHAAITFG